MQEETELHLLYPLTISYYSADKKPLMHPVLKFPGLEILGSGNTEEQILMNAVEDIEYMLSRASYYSHYQMSPANQRHLERLKFARNVCYRRIYHSHKETNLIIE